MLKKAVNGYHNRTIATQEVIEELIQLAKAMSAATHAASILARMTTKSP